jgi:predicted O-methyltransferase YrrM
MDIDPELLAATKGFLDPAEGACLYQLAREASRLGPCLEIGSYCGKSTLYLGAGCRENGGILYAVDHHGGSEEQQPGQPYCDPDLVDPRTGRVDTFAYFRRTIAAAGLVETVVPVVAPSDVAARQWRTPLALVFIDGGHTYAAAFMDYNAWAGYLIPGGALAIHDIFATPAEGGQAPRHVYELARASGLFEDRGQVKTLGVLRRRTGAQLPSDLPR